jgi:predicted metal-dependent phosphoesterase TrpH
MKTIDLHVHTNISDGTLTPTEVVQRALNLNLSAIAITDHDTVAGVVEAKQAALNLAGEHIDFEVISGVEISAEYHGKDIHILGLYVNENDETLISALKLALEKREERNELMTARLREDGIPIHIEDLYYGEPNTVITRAHFARFLVENHYAKNNNEAFSRYLDSNTKYYVPRTYMTPQTAINLIKDAGGIPILAHPLLYKLDLKGLDELIAYVKSLGIEGIETIYSSNTGFDEGIVRRYVNKYDLLMTGGSDFHGANKPLIELGSGRGNLVIPYEILEAIKTKLGK